jgi:hypothetical protein
MTRMAFFVTNPLGSPKPKLDERFGLESSVHREGFGLTEPEIGEPDIFAEFGKLL